MATVHEAMADFLGHPTPPAAERFLTRWMPLSAEDREHWMRQLYALGTERVEGANSAWKQQWGHQYPRLSHAMLRHHAIQRFLETPTQQTVQTLAALLSHDADAATLLPRIRQAIDVPHPRHKALETGYALLLQYLERPSEVSLPIRYPPTESREASAQYLQEFTTSDSVLQYIRGVLEADIFIPHADANASHNKNKRIRTWVREKGEGKHLYERLFTILERTPKKAHTHLAEHLKVERLRNIYTVAEFLRSYIDFHHDFTRLARDLIAPTREAFEARTDLRQPLHHKGRATTLRAWYAQWIARIDGGIFTRGGNVDQRACRTWMQLLVDDVILLIRDPQNVGAEGVVDWIPLTRLAGKMKEYRIRRGVKSSENAEDAENNAAGAENTEGSYDQAVLERLREDLKTIGVRQCFWESSGNHAYRSLIRAGSGITNMTMLLASWDGLRKDTRGSPMGATASTLDLFGGVLHVEANTERLEAVWRGATREERLKISPRQPLNLNRLLGACGIAPLRPVIGEVQPLQGIQTTHTKILPLLKTWTDFVQILTLLDTQQAGSNLTAMCTVDTFCVLTAQMYGLPFVLESGRDVMTMYHFDTSAIYAYAQQTKEQRAETLAAVLYDREGWKTYLAGWFDSVIAWLTPFAEWLYDPALYMGIQQFLKSVQAAKVIAAEEWALFERAMREEDLLRGLLLDFPTSLTEWFQRMTQSSQLIEDMREAHDGIRVGMEALRTAKDALAWRTAYQAMKQLAVNARGEDPSRMVVGLMAISSIETKEPVQERLKALWAVAQETLLDLVQRMGAPQGSKKISTAMDPPIEFTKIVLPTSARRGVYRLEEWEFSLGLLRQAKRGAVVADPIAANVLELYHVLLQNREVAEYVEVLLLTGCVLLKMDTNTAPFEFEQTEEMEVEEVEEVRHQRQYTFTSWGDQFARGKTKSYTLSMVDPMNSMEGVMRRIATYAPEADLGGLVGRGSRYMHSLCELESGMEFRAYNVQRCTTSPALRQAWIQVAAEVSLDVVIAPVLPPHPSPHLSSRPSTPFSHRVMAQMNRESESTRKKPRLSFANLASPAPASPAPASPAPASPAPTSPASPISESPESPAYAPFTPRSWKDLPRKIKGSITPRKGGRRNTRKRT